MKASGDKEGEEEEDGETGLVLASQFYSFVYPPSFIILSNFWVLSFLCFHLPRLHGILHIAPHFKKMSETYLKSAFTARLVIEAVMSSYSYNRILTKSLYSPREQLCGAVQYLSSQLTSSLRQYCKQNNLSGFHFKWTVLMQCTLLFFVSLTLKHKDQPQSHRKPFASDVGQIKKRGKKKLHFHFIILWLKCFLKYWLFSD